MTNFSNRVLDMTPEAVAAYFQQSLDLQCMADDVAKSLSVTVTGKPGRDPGPERWQELSQEQRAKVDRYIDTLLAQQAPLFEVVTKPGREVIEQKVLGSVSYQLERVKCGKGCKGCPHGPYWYAYFRGKKGKQVSQYIGKDFKPLSSLM